MDLEEPFQDSHFHRQVTVEVVVTVVVVTVVVEVVVVDWVVDNHLGFSTDKCGFWTKNSENEGIEGMQPHWKDWFYWRPGYPCSDAADDCQVVELLVVEDAHGENLDSARMDIS